MPYQQNIPDKISLGTRLNLRKANCITCKTVFCCNLLKNGFKWLAYVKQNLTGKFSTREKANRQRKTQDEMMAVKLLSTEEAQMV